MKKVLLFCLALALSTPAFAARGLTVGDSTVVEGGQWCVTVAASLPRNQSASFRYTTVNDTAKAGVDFVAKSGQQTVRKNTNQITICGATIQNTVFQNDRRFFVDITAVSNATIVRARGYITLRDDDPKPTVTWCKGGVTVPYGQPCPPDPPATQTCPDGSVIPATSVCPVVPPTPTGWIQYPLTEPYRGLNKATHALATVTCPSIKPDWGPGVTAGQVYVLVGIGAHHYEGGPNINHWSVVKEGSGPVTTSNPSSTVLTECLIGLHKGVPQLIWTTPSK